MKLSNKLFFCLALLVTLGLGALFYNSANAQSSNEITDAEISLIRTNCVSIQDTLNRVHASDALLRVNTGQVYESISTKLMEGFNSRVVGNNLNGAKLVSVSSDYKDALNKFRLDYIDYEEKMSLAMSTNCSKQPVAFYDAIAVARTKRKQVNADVKQLNGLINDYKKAVDEVESDYQILKGVTK